MPLQPSFKSAQPPPDFPSVNNVDAKLVDYLRRFSLWCRNGFSNKLDVNAALPGVLLIANDATPGATPVVWSIQVNTAGTISAHAVPLGSGYP